jgi:hypothetical protein
LNVLTLSNALLITFCVPSYYDDIHALVGLADGAHSFGNSVSRDFVQPTFVSLLQNTCISIYIRNSSLYIGVVTFQFQYKAIFSLLHVSVCGCGATLPIGTVALVDSYRG